MEEFKFVIKCFLFSCLIVIFSQARISGDTIENQAFVFLQHSEISDWIRAVADGGIRLIRRGAETTKDFFSDKFEKNENQSHTIRKDEVVVETNTGLFRKLERHKIQQKKTQQIVDAVEPELNEENDNEENF